MRSIFLLSAFCLLFTVAGFAQDEAAPAIASGPAMELESDEIDYGVIERHSEPLRTLKFTNVGDEPLVISNARGSCGCTVPTWPKEPILPGESSVLEIRYATNRIGSFNKKVTLTTNEASDKNTHVIAVKGKVLKEDEQETVPAAAPSVIPGVGSGSGK